MIRRRYSCCGAALPHSEGMVVFGGDDAGDDSHPTDTCECFSLHATRWTSFPPMSQARCLISCVTLSDSQIVVLGGWDGHRVLTLDETYDPFTKRWHAGVSVPSPRSSFAATVCDDFIYVLGGLDGREFLSSCIRFDFSTSAWTKWADLDVARLNPRACCFFRC